MKINKKGYNKNTCIRQNFPEIIRANKIKTDEGYERYCGICGELMTIEDVMSDETNLSFILRVVMPDKNNEGEIITLPQVFAIHKSCYLNHFKIMKGIIENYNEDFFIEGL